MTYEKKLIEKSKKGNIKAFEALIEKHQQKVYNIALQMLNNPDDAFDVSQEVFIKVFNSISNFKGNSSFSTWLYRITTNTCLDEIRRRKRTQTISIDSPIQLEDGDVNIQIKDDSPQPDEIIERKELQIEVMSAIQELTKDHKAVIILRDINNLPYEEISEVLECSLGTVKSRLSRARMALKNIILEKRKELLNKHSV